MCDFAWLWVLITSSFAFISVLQCKHLALIFVTPCLNQENSLSHSLLYILWPLGFPILFFHFNSLKLYEYLMNWINLILPTMTEWKIATGVYTVQVYAHMMVFVYIQPIPVRLSVHFNVHCTHTLTRLMRISQYATQLQSAEQGA